MAGKRSLMSSLSNEEISQFERNSIDHVGSPSDAALMSSISKVLAGLLFMRIHYNENVNTVSHLIRIKQYEQCEDNMSMTGFA